MPKASNNGKHPRQDDPDDQLPAPKRPAPSRQVSLSGTLQEDDVVILDAQQPLAPAIDVQKRLDALDAFTVQVETKFEEQGRQLKEILNHVIGQRDRGNDDDDDDGDIQRGNTAPKSPLQFVKKTFPWVSDSIVRDIVELKLEVKDLPKLIPTRFRSKGRVAAGGITGTSILYDTSTATAQIIEPDQPAYDKEIPDMKVLSYILHVYATIRGLWDQIDNTFIGAAINAYAAMLLMWERFERYSFKCILLYFIDHFETHQQSMDPGVWTTVDQHLHSLHMRPPPEPATTSNPLHFAPASPTKRQTSPSKDKAICRNYNTASKGCPYQNCTRRHICILCASDSQTQPVFRCTMHSSAASPSK